MSQCFRRGQEVAKTAHGVSSSASGIGPDAQEIDEEVAGELDGQHLRDDVEVGDEGGLEDDRDVGRVEQFDGVRGVLAAITGALDGQVDAETLKFKKVPVKMVLSCDLLFFHPARWCLGKSFPFSHCKSNKGLPISCFQLRLKDGYMSVLSHKYPQELQTL